jgi:hypothetical protein
MILPMLFVGIWTTGIYLISVFGTKERKGTKRTEMNLL